MASARGFGFGIVGLGMIAEFHGRAIQAMRGGRLAGAFSRRGGDQARALAQQYGMPLYVGDYDAFLNHPGLDIVTIATPSGAHLEPVVAAATAGKHVICEKPLEITLERCDRMIAACNQHQVQLGGIFPSRTGAAVQTIKQAIEAQRFGRLTVCNAAIPWYRAQAYYDSGGWRGTWALDGGGALMNQSIHTIDLLQWFAGPIAELHAFAGNLIHQRIEVEDTAVAIVKYGSGALGTITGSTAMWPGQALEIHLAGENGSVRLRGSDIVQWDFADQQSSDARIRRRFAPAPQQAQKGGAADPQAISFEGHRKQFENFVRCLRGKDTLLVDGPEARKAVEIILGIYASARSGKTVTLPLQKTPCARNHRVG
jgi:UDP-N-acetyl-2-amino-2-deoxyglucuronate dehydrogenase